MRNQNFSRILYFISVVILATLTIQFYWNYKNYRDGKNQLIREVQSSVDNAIDSYFITLADKNTIGITLKEDGNVLANPQVDSLLRKIDQSGKGLNFINNIDPSEISEINVITGSELRIKDTVPGASDSSNNNLDLHKIEGTGTVNGNKKITNLANRIILTLNTDTIDVNVLNNYIDEQLTAKNIDIKYAYLFKRKEGVIQKFDMEDIDDSFIHTSANSAYLPQNSTFELYIANLAPTVLQRNTPSIILSALLVIAVVFCLFFLLKIINRQKQLAELKNDLIDNITHEFKTPIATAKVALEGIQMFNKDNDPVKTRNYLQVSNAQLDKLQFMVEKLLETATIDGDNLQFKKEKVHLVMMLSELIEKHQNLAATKRFIFSPEENEISVIADAFHLENALNNILDNAVKYGGNKIEVSVSSINEVVKIGITDNGGNLTKHQAEQLFDKFYRVPKGNTHDVKGFGIGLYYSKNIIEKHGGSIELLLNNQTNFIITIPLNG